MSGFLKVTFWSYMFSFVTFINPLGIDRVILSVNTNPNYMQFWPIVAKAWARIGIKPTLALICDGPYSIDESLGDVIKFDSIPGVPASFYAKMIRLFLPAYFENETCLISDIDMLPLNKNYFFDSVKTFSEDKFIIYTSEYGDAKRFFMCFNLAKGKVFKDIFKISDIQSIPSKIKQLRDKAISMVNDFKVCKTEEEMLGNMDEDMLTSCIYNWPNYSSKVIKLDHDASMLWINKYDGFKYNLDLIKLNFYCSAHMPGPYLDPKNKDRIDVIIKLVGMEDIITAIK